MRVDHVSLTVSNLDRSIDFYTRCFDFRVVSPPRDSSARNVEVITGYSFAHLRIAHLELDGSFLELIEYVHPKGEHRARLETKDVATPHLAFHSTDIWQDYQRLKVLGVRFKSEPQVNPSGTIAVYGLDVDGIPLEIIQRPAR